MKSQIFAILGFAVLIALTEARIIFHQSESGNQLATSPMSPKDVQGSSALASKAGGSGDAASKVTGPSVPPVPVQESNHQHKANPEIESLLPASAEGQALKYLFEHMLCQHQVVNRDPQYDQALQALNSNPQKALRLFESVLNALPEKFFRERQEVLHLARDLKLNPEDRSRFYLGQSLKELGAASTLAGEVVRQTAFDYYLDQPDLSNSQRESALADALETHSQSRGLQEQLVLLFARFDEVRAKAIARQHGL